MAAAKNKSKAALLGVGLDDDGHKRITQGENFLLVGGSKDTHEQMTEKVIKLSEQIKARGKHLETITQEEFAEIAHKVGLKKVPARKPHEN